MDFYYVDIRHITPPTDECHYDRKKVEELTDLIIECGHLLKPLLLKRTGAEQFEILSGHVEYHAAVMAREKKPRAHETVNAFVISEISALRGADRPEVETLAMKQMRVLKTLESAAA